MRAKKQKPESEKREELPRTQCPVCKRMTASPFGGLCGLCEMDDDVQGLMDRDRE